MTCEFGFARLKQVTTLTKTKERPRKKQGGLKSGRLGARCGLRSRGLRSSLGREVVRRRGAAPDQLLRRPLDGHRHLEIVELVGRLDLGAHPGLEQTLVTCGVKRLVHLCDECLELLRLEGLQGLHKEQSTQRARA